MTTLGIMTAHICVFDYLPVGPPVSQMGQHDLSEHTFVVTSPLCPSPFVFKKTNDRK